MTATVYTPGGSSDRSRGKRAYSREHFGKQDPSSVDDSGFPENTTGANATPPPLRNLLAVMIDPTWYAEHKSSWASPLGDRLPMTFLALDEGITENAAVDYAPTQVLGRAETYQSYIGTQNREVQLMFQYRAQGLEGTNEQDTIRREVINPARWLDALKYPVVRGDLHVPPPPVILVLGQLLTMRAIVTAATIRWGPQFDPGTMLPLSADVDVTFTAVHTSLGGYAFEGSSRFETFQPPSILSQPVIGPAISQTLV